MVIYALRTKTSKELIYYSLNIENNRIEFTLSLIGDLPVTSLYKEELEDIISSNSQLGDKKSPFKNIILNKNIEVFKLKSV